MATNVQWTPSVIIRNLTEEGGSHTKAFNEYTKLSADRMALVLGNIRRSADSKTFTDMTNILILKASAPGTPENESRIAQAFLAFMEDHNS